MFHPNVSPGKTAQLSLLPMNLTALRPAHLVRSFVVELIKIFGVLYCSLLVPLVKTNKLLIDKDNWLDDELMKDG